MTNASQLLTRRRFLHRCAAFSAFSVTPGLLSACGGSGGGDSAGGNPDQSSDGESQKPDAVVWNWPDEGAAHAASWMSFQVSAAIWGRDMVAPVQEALARIANAIIAFEPLNVIVAPENMARARALLDARIRLVSGAADDLWIRDTGCITVRNAQGEKRALSFNFNGWGNKQAYSRDATVAQQMSQQQAVNLVRSRLVLEGGALETDGEGTAIITESCVLNANRNPGWTKAAVEAELKAINPTGRITRAVKGVVEPDLLLSVGIDRARVVTGLAHCSQQGIGRDAAAEGRMCLFGGEIDGRADALKAVERFFDARRAGSTGHARDRQIKGANDGGGFGGHRA